MRLAVIALVLAGPAAAKSATHLTRNDKTSLEEEAPIPAIVLAVAGDLAVEWVAGYVYDKVTENTRGHCLRKSEVMDTWTGDAGVRTVDDDLLRLCETRPLKFSSAAKKSKYWHVHSRNWHLSKCEFKFEWQFKAGGTVFNCYPETIKRLHGEDTYNHLRKKYPNDKFFRQYVGGVQVVIQDCDLERHKGYVSVYPSLPYDAFSKTPARKAAYANNPKFYVNVEGWTFGECSGWKKPGVKWTFTYEVDVEKGTVEYVTKKSSSTNRPYTSFNHYVPDLSKTALRVRNYKEKTKALAEVYGIDLEG
jgi:hypothetical protein